MKSLTMNISLPEPMKSFVDEQVDEHHYNGASEYIRQLIRRDQMARKALEDQRQRVDALLREGLDSPLDGMADKAFIQEMRARAVSRRAEAPDAAQRLAARQSR